MKRSLISVAVAAIGLTSSRSYSFSVPAWGQHSSEPVAPTVSKERRCAQCHVGIVTGRHCFSCTQSKRK